jgi:branched-chain amino acid transport system substrate-binding protein
LIPITTIRDQTEMRLQMRVRTRRGVLATGTLILGATLATACSAPGASSSSSGGSSGSGPIKFALIDAQSGQYSSLGKWEHNGVQLAVDEVNGKGGVCGGRQMSLTQFDDQGDPTIGTTLAQKVSTGDYAAVFGSANSGVTLAMIPALSQAKIPTITSGQSPKLEQTGSRFLFLNSPTSTTFDTTLAKYVVQTKNLKSIAMMTNNGAYGSGEHDAFLAALKSLGATAAADQVVTPDQKDFSAALTTIRQANPQALFIGAEEVESGLIAKQARELGIQALIVGGAPIGTQQYIDTAGLTNAEGSLVSSPYLSNDANAQTRAFADAYKKKFGEDAEAHGAKAYDGAQIFIKAVQDSNCATGEKLADAIRNTKYQGLQGAFSFNEKGIGLSSTQIGVIQAGKVVTAQS